MAIRKLILGSNEARQHEPSLVEPCPKCGAPPKATHYVSPESECYEKEGDVDCLDCNHAWNDQDIFPKGIDDSIGG